MSYSLCDWVIAPYSPFFGVRRSAHVSAVDCARKPEAELDWTVIALPCSHSAKLKPGIGHHGLREFGFLYRGVAPWRWIEDCHRRPIAEGKREQRRGQKILPHIKMVGCIVQSSARGTVAVVGWVAIQRARRHVVDIGPTNRRRKLKSHRRVETTRRVTDDLHSSTQGKYGPLYAPVVHEAKYHVVIINFGSGIDCRRRFLERFVCSSKLTNVTFRAKDFQPCGLRLRNGGEFSTDDFDSPPAR